MSEVELTIVTMAFDSAQPERLQSVLAKYVVLSRGHPGCRNIDLCASATTPGRFVLIEKWESPEAQRAHFDSEEMVGMAGDLFRRYAPRSNVGTLDLLHVAAARRFGCQWFLSFDSASGCRAVAHACGLKAFPELTPEDRVWLRRIGGGN